MKRTKTYRRFEWAEWCMNYTGNISRENMMTEQGAVVTEAWNGKEVADIYESCESGTFDDDIEQSLAAGMNMHLAKPLEFQKVIEAIAALVVQ